MANPTGNPATQFGAPGGPDPVEAGRKGGQAARGTSILGQIFKRLDEQTASDIAQVVIEKLSDEEKLDVSLLKEVVARQDGLMTQSTDMRITGDRTVVLGDKAETPPDMPEEGA